MRHGSHRYNRSLPALADGDVGSRLDDRLSSVTHADGTARVQTISSDFNPSVWKLLELIAAQTKEPPVLINTSLNILGTAINETTEDTLWAFSMTPQVTTAVINNAVVSKR